MRSNIISSRFKLAIVYPTGHVWIGVRVDGGSRWGRGRAKRRLHEEAVKMPNVPLTSWDFTNYFQHFLFDSTVLCWIKLKVPFKHWLIKNKSTFDVDALMTFTVITWPFFFFFSSRKPSKWVRLKTESTVFRQKQTHVKLMSETVRHFFS